MPTRTFAKFMQRALYEPGKGYYTSGKERIGKRGDFVTASSIPVFGECIARWTWQCWKTMGRPRTFTILELGAGDGSLARTILAYFKQAYRWRPQYLAVEVRPRASGGGIKWITKHDCLKLKRITGVIISNEFFDALPTHRVMWRDGALKEVYSNNRIDAISSRKIIEYWERYGAELAEFQQAEANLEALGLLEHVSWVLERGYVLTIDYGDVAEKLYTSERFDGTVLGYRNHQATDLVYNKPGKQDITAHVNFTALIKRGEELGMETTRFTSQANFLLENGILEHAPKASNTLSGVATHQHIKKLLLPSGFGEKFKALVQKKA